MCKELSNCIKELRKKKGFTQKELAALLGIGQTTIANYEKGTRVPDTNMLNRLADFFEVSLDFLVGRKEKGASVPNEVSSYDEHENCIDEMYRIYVAHLLKGEKEEARKLILRNYDRGVKIEDIYFKIFGKAFTEVGLLWEKGMIDIWEEHLITDMTIDLMREIVCKTSKKDEKNYSILALTAGAEFHTVGLKMIIDLLEIEGWRAAYLGSNVPIQSLLRAIEARKPDILAISVTMHYHINSATSMITAVRNRFGKEAPKIIVGGLAFAEDVNSYKDTGADFYGINVEDLKKIIEKSEI